MNARIAWLVFALVTAHLLLRNSFSQAQDDNQPSTEVSEAKWTGEFRVFSRNFNGQYSEVAPRVTEISRQGENYVLRWHRDYLLTKRGEKALVNARDLEAPPVLAFQSENPRVLSLQFSFKTIFLLDGDVPRTWCLENEETQVDEEIFKLLPEHGTELPESLKQAYSTLLRWSECDCRLETFVLPNADVDEALLRKLLKDGSKFDSKLVRTFAYRNTYMLTTGSSVMHWVQTEDDSWQLYRFEQNVGPRELSFDRQSDAEAGFFSSLHASQGWRNSEHQNFLYVVRELSLSEATEQRRYRILSGSVHHFNTGVPIERVPVFFGNDFNAKLAGFSNAEGRFSFRIYDSGVSVPGGSVQLSEGEDPTSQTAFLYIGGAMSEEEGMGGAGMAQLAVSVVGPRHLLKDSVSLRYDVSQLFANPKN